jgi:hypothetical protein
MKVSKRSLVGATVVALVAVLALLSAASIAGAQRGATDQAGSPRPVLSAMVEPGRGEPPDRRSALDNVDAFTKTLTTAGFSLQQGGFTYWDLVKETCQGHLPDTLANNPWPNVYVVLQMPPHPGVQPPLVDRYWQLGKDEAIVLVGNTPPSAKFFSYQTFMITLPASDQRMGVPVGDSINIGTIKTIGPDKDNRPIVYIITGNRETERRVRAAALKAGYPDAIINVEAVSPVIAPLGAGDEGSWLAFGHRVAVPFDKTAVENYARNPPYKVFRVTPNQPLKDDPEPVPVLRTRGTGHTEMALYPSLKKLRQAILDANGGKPVKELDTKVWQLTTPPGNREMIVEKPYVGLQRGIQVIGATRDTNYLATYPNFELRSGVDEFVLVYGVNHQTTGKVTYTSFSIYADKDRWFGLKDGTMTSPKYDDPDGDGPLTGNPGDSAKKYLCPDAQHCDPNWQNFYVWKVARDCHGEAYCMPVKEEFAGLDGQPYQCNLYDWYANPVDPTLIGQFDLDNAEMFFLWRSYMEPDTKIGPDDNELLYDRAIYFGPYFAGQQ